MPALKSINTLQSHRSIAPAASQSHDQTRLRFDSCAAAARYPSEFGDSFRARRELRCLQNCLAHVESGSKVLDLPCGSGRLLPWLCEHGFQLTAADFSPHMVEKASRFVESKLGPDTPIRFEVRDVMQSKFETAEFDAILCHRLFHHFTEPEARITALRELHRISSGPVIVSFFNSFALDAIRFRLKHFLRRSRPTDRIPIPLTQFGEEIQQAGFEIAHKQAVLWGLSPLWCLVLRHRPETQAGSSSTGGKDIR